MKDYLFKKNLPVKQLAADLKISASYLYQLIRGERKPSIGLAQKIEKYTDGEVTLRMLLGIKAGKEKLETSYESIGDEYEERFSLLENASGKFERKLKEIEGRLLKLEEKNIPK